VITHVPALTPVITPVAELIVSVEAQAALQDPPAVALVAVAVEPTQVARPPPIGSGNGFTVTTIVLTQPVGSVYDIIAVPVAMPVTIPVEDPMVAINVLPLAQVPPPGLPLSVVVEPTQTLALGLAIIVGNGFTVTTAVMRQPVGAVYVTKHVGAPIPVTIPVDAPIFNIAGQALLHVPPAVAFVRLVVEPTQTDSVPPIAGGFGLTVAMAVVTQPAAV
jgi:hypothetical protein